MTSPQGTDSLTELRNEIATVRQEIADNSSATDDQYADLSAKIDRLIESHNAVGENLQWLVANTQGIFQMFNNPQMMSQIMGQFMGGVSKVG